MSRTDKDYVQIMNDAVEHVHIFAVRRGIESRLLRVTFDADRGPGPHAAHTLTISIVDSGISVLGRDIPHEWLSVGTSFIDVRYSKCIATLLQELENKAQQAGRPI